MTSRRRLALMLMLTTAAIAVCVGLNFALNPYGAWQVRLIDPVFRKVEQEHVVTPYLLRSTEPEMLLLGSSRVWRGMRIEQGERDGVMNAALKGATIPQLSEIVSLALKNPRLRRIVWGVDFFAFEEKWGREGADFDARMAGSLGYRLEDTLISLGALEDGLGELRRAIRGVGKLQPTERALLPWPMPLVCSDLERHQQNGLAGAKSEEIEAQAVNVLRYYVGYRSSARFREIFRETVENARRHGVEVILFVPPMTAYEIELIRQTGNWNAFQNWKRELLKAGSFQDFSGYNEIGRTDSAFIDIMHFKPAVGQIILHNLLGGKLEPCSKLAALVANSAVRIDETSIARELAAQDRMLETETRSDSRYSKIAARAIVRRAKNYEVEAADLASGDDASARTFEARTHPQ
jgi:hypothetical protein